MAMEITNNYNAYENVYATQKQETAKKQAASGKETSETVDTQKNSKVENGKMKSSTAAYAKELAKLAPSVEFGVGSALSSVKSGKTLTINPKLLEKMQNNPAQEKEMKELIKGVESVTKLSASINKASGWTVVYQHSYIDENGKYHSVGYYRNDFMLNMSDKLREERRKNSEKLIEKTKEKAADKKEKLEEALEEKKAEKAEDGTATPDKAEQLLEEKMVDSEDGMVYLNDTDIRTIIEAAQEDDAGKTTVKEQAQVGTNLDLKI